MIQGTAKAQPSITSHRLGQTREQVAKAKGNNMVEGARDPSHPQPPAKRAAPHSNDWPYQSGRHPDSRQRRRGLSSLSRFQSPSNHPRSRPDQSSPDFASCAAGKNALERKRVLRRLSSRRKTRQTLAGRKRVASFKAELGHPRHRYSTLLNRALPQGVSKLGLLLSDSPRVISTSRQ